jgi:hypothetical protein
LGQELVVVQQSGKPGAVHNTIWRNVQGNLLQPNEATIRECIGEAVVQDTLFFNDLGARSNYRNRIVGVQTACLHHEIKKHPGLLEQLLADRTIPIAANTDPLQAELNAIVQLTGYRGMLPQMQAYQYSRRGKEGRGVQLLAADKNLVCSLASADEIYSRFGGLTQTAIFERVEMERNKYQAPRRTAVVKPNTSVSSSGGIAGPLPADQSDENVPDSTDLRIVSGDVLGTFELGFLTSRVLDYAVLAVERKGQKYQVTLVANGTEDTANLCDYALTFLRDGDDRA